MKQLGRIRDPCFFVGLVLFLATFALFVTTLAPSIVPGDPGEYQFVPHIVGIAHPPGYAFFTILAKVWTSIVRIGSVAYRTNLLAAAAGAWTAVMVYGIALQLWEPGAWESRDETKKESGPAGSPLTRIIPALYGAVVLATAADFWQHSIHANAHIVSGALSATTLFCGLRWWASGRDRWLYVFAFLAALGVTHHPLLAFGALAYVVFVLSVRPRLLFDWHRLVAIAAAVILGLGVFLYLPLRAGATPFGPSSNLDAVIGHATARGIRGNLFYFGLEDQPVRLRVYWELLRLQYAPLTLLLALCGVGWLAWRRTRPFVLLAVYAVVYLAFIINTVQDVMAYLLLPFTATAIFASAGVLGLFKAISRLRWNRTWQRVVLVGFTLILFVGPLLSVPHKIPRISLRDYRLADEFIQAVQEQFSGKREGAILLAPWEALTPLFYTEHVKDQPFDPQDVKLVFVASGSANPWVENVWRHIEEGPIYLADYRPQVSAEGFRLRPVGHWPFYSLVAPPATSEPEIPNQLGAVFGDTIHVIGWDLDRTELQAGGTAYLTLQMTALQELDAYYMPYLRLGDRAYRWTTDSRLNTPWWQPGEIVVERYEITVPFNTPPGEYTLRLGMNNLSEGRDLTLADGDATVELPTSLRVAQPSIAPRGEVLEKALANINSRIVLEGGSASSWGQRFEVPWSEPLRVRPGDDVQIWLDWRALAAVDHPYTVFVHLLDDKGRLWAQHDYTPMGGAFPTFLWIPRWFEGQSVSDPYRLAVPHDTPPGDYLIEVGMYGMTDHRRAYHFDTEGNLAGDRYILGPVQVVEP